MARHEEHPSTNPYISMQRNSVMTTFSIPESLTSETLETRSLENIVLSSERPMLVKNPFYKPLPLPPAPLPPPPESPWKPWMPKLLIALFSVLGLALVLAVVLVILAATGYLGKGKVEIIDVVQPTATATATATAIETPTSKEMVMVTTTATAARALRTLAGRGVPMVVESSAGKTMKSVGILVAEVMLGWGLVYLFEKFEHREKEKPQKKPESRGREKRKRSQSSTSSSSGSSRSRSRSRSRGRGRGRSR